MTPVVLVCPLHSTQTCFFLSCRQSGLREPDAESVELQSAMKCLQLMLLEVTVLRAYVMKFD